MNIESLKEAALKIADHSAADMVSSYLLEKEEREPTANDVNRAGCSPLGVSEEIWPKYDGSKMYHVVTLDLDSVPRLKPNFAPDIRAVSLFVSHLVGHEAYEVGNNHVAVLQLDRDCIESGVMAVNPPNDEDYREPEPCTFKCHEVELPSMIFDPEIAYEIDMDDDGEPFAEVLQALGYYSIAGDKPIWVQGQEYDGNFVLQFNDELVDMNCGDTGYFYVFEDTAFTQ